MSKEIETNAGEIWPTYGGITRGASIAGINNTPNWKETSPLTLEELDAAMKSLPKFEPNPPHYRCNQRTYDTLKYHFARRVPMSEFPPNMRHLSGVYVYVDQTVPDGEFLPPMDWNISK